MWHKAQCLKITQKSLIINFEILFMAGKFKWDILGWFSNTVDQKIGCLFDISLDPCEQVNLVSIHPEIVKGLKAELQKLERTAVEPTNGPKDPQANPKYWGYIWTHWKDLWLVMNVTQDFMHSIKHVTRFLWWQELQLWAKAAIALWMLLCRNSQKNRSRKLFLTAVLLLDFLDLFLWHLGKFLSSSQKSQSLQVVSGTKGLFVQLYLVVHYLYNSVL